MWNEIQLKGQKRQKQAQEQNKKEWANSVGLCQRHKPQHPHNVKVNPWGLKFEAKKETTETATANLL